MIDKIFFKEKCLFALMCVTLVVCHSYVTAVTHSCKNQVHIGPGDDGGWDVCLEDRFDISAPCLIYSFG